MCPNSITFEFQIRRASFFADMFYCLGRTGLATGSGTADESKEAELASALQKIVSSPDEIGFSTGTRTVSITYVVFLAHLHFQPQLEMGIRMHV